MKEDTPDKKKQELDATVHSRIKGLGLDALFHQVDVSKKDDDPYQHKAPGTNDEERALLERLQNMHCNKRDKNFFARYTMALGKTVNGKGNTDVYIDFGRSAIKVLATKTLKEETAVIAVACVNVPHIVAMSQAKYEEFAAHTVLGALEPSLLRQASVSVLFPASKAITRTLEVPTEDEAEIKKMLAFEAEHHLPISPLELEWDYQILKKEKNKSQLLLAAVKKDDVMCKLRVLEKTGLKINRIGLSSLGLYQALEPDATVRGTMLEVSVGASCTDINVIVDGVLVYCRGLEWGSENLTGRIADSLHVDFEDAEKIKKENGIILARTASANSTQKAVSGLARQWADELAGHVRTTIEHFQLKHGTCAIESLSLSGGGSRLANLNEALRDTLNVKVTHARPRDGILFDCDPRDYHKYFHELSSLVGTCLTGRRREQINLLPQALKSSMERARVRLKNFFAVASLAIGVAAIVILPAGLLALRRLQLVMMDAAITRLETRTATVRAIQEKMSTIEDYISTKQSSMEVMRQVSLAVPADVIIEQFSFEKNKSVTLTGIASSHDSVVGFSRSLSESALFENTNVNYTRNKDRLTQEVSFAVTCSLR